MALYRYILKRECESIAIYTRGVRRFFIKTSRDVGMVPPIYQVAAWENQPVEKVEKQGGVYHDILVTQVNIRQLQVTHEPHACKLSLQAYKH